MVKGVREMAQRLKALSALQKDLNSVASIQISWFTIA